MIAARIPAHIFTEAEKEYIDRYMQLALNIVHWYIDGPMSSDRAYRYLNMLWEIADNQAEPAMTDRLFCFLRDDTPWNWLRHRHNP